MGAIARATLSEDIADSIAILGGELADLTTNIRKHRRIMPRSLKLRASRIRTSPGRQHVSLGRPAVSMQLTCTWQRGLARSETIRQLPIRRGDFGAHFPSLPMVGVLALPRACTHSPRARSFRHGSAMPRGTRASPIWEGVSSDLLVAKLTRAQLACNLRRRQHRPSVQRIRR